MRDNTQISQNGHSKGANGLPHLPVEAPPSFHPLNESVGEYELAGALSPSQVSTFIACPAKYWFKYGLGMQQTQGSALSLGKAFHAVVSENLKQKIETKRDLQLTGVLALYEDAWGEQAAETEFQRDEDPDQVKKMGRACLTKYHEEVAPLIEPAEVEMPVAGVIGGVHVRGFVDVLDVHGRIIDLKSAKATPSKGVIRPDYRFQVSTYEAITPGASGEARLDTIVKLSREVKHVAQDFTVGDEDRRHVEVMYPLIQADMRSGYYPPHRNSFLCSRKYCSFVSECLREYGGAVAGESA